MVVFPFLRASCEDRCLCVRAHDLGKLSTGNIHLPALNFRG